MSPTLWHAYGLELSLSLGTVEFGIGVLQGCTTDTLAAIVPVTLACMLPCLDTPASWSTPWQLSMLACAKSQGYRTFIILPLHFAATQCC